MAVPSERLKKLPQALLENRGSHHAAMQAVGYSENYAANPSQLRSTAAYAEVMAPVAKQLEERRQAAIKRLTDVKLDKAKATEVMEVIDKLTKNIQILTGGVTQNVKFSFEEMSEDQLRALAARKDEPGGTSDKGPG